jgi:hypothetical protein
VRPMAKSKKKPTPKTGSPRNAKYSELERLFRRGALDSNRNENFRLFAAGERYHRVMAAANSLGSATAIDYKRPMVDHSSVCAVVDQYIQQIDCSKKAYYWRKLLSIKLQAVLDAVIVCDMNIEHAAQHVLGPFSGPVPKLAKERIRERLCIGLDQLAGFIGQAGYPG